MGPRFFQNNVLGQRLMAFKTIAVVAVLIVNLSIKEILIMQKAVRLSFGWAAVSDYIGLCVQLAVLVLDIFAVLVLIQQMFHTYRLLTSGPTGFELAKMYYMSPNIVGLRHLAVKSFLVSVPLFVISTACMIWMQMKEDNSGWMSVPIGVGLTLAAFGLWVVQIVQFRSFKLSYDFTTAHQEPLLTHVEQVTARSTGPVLDV